VKQYPVPTVRTILRNILRPELLAKIQESILQVARWRIWLRHCATNRKVRESLRIFINKILPAAPRPCGRLSLLIEMSKTKITAAGVGMTILSHSCADCFSNLRASNSWNPQGLYRDCFLLYRSCGSNNVSKQQFGSRLLSNYAQVKPASSAVT